MGAGGAARSASSSVVPSTHSLSGKPTEKESQAKRRTDPHCLGELADCQHVPLESLRSDLQKDICRELSTVHTKLLTQSAPH